MAVSKDTIGRDVYRAIVTLLKANLTDSQTPTRSANDWILSAFPDEESITRTSFPIVVVDKVEFTTKNKTLQKTSAHITARITVFSAATTTGTKPAQVCDDLMDQIVHVMGDNKYTTIRNSNDIYNLEVANMTGNTMLFGSLKIHIKGVTFTGDFTFSD